MTFFKEDKSKVDLEGVGVISKCLSSRHSKKKDLKNYDKEWKHKAVFVDLQAVWHIVYGGTLTATIANEEPGEIDINHKEPEFNFTLSRTTANFQKND